MYCQCQCYLVLRFMVMERIKSNAGWYCKKHHFNIFKLFHYQRLCQIMVTLCVKKNNIKFLVNKQQGKEILQILTIKPSISPKVFPFKACTKRLDMTHKMTWHSTGLIPIKNTRQDLGLFETLNQIHIRQTVLWFEVCSVPWYFFQVSLVAQKSTRVAKLLEKLALLLALTSLWVKRHKLSFSLALLTLYNPGW